jgi:divalent metal cation (Fe/Co/Zn/Cd) transporter
MGPSYILLNLSVNFKDSLEVASIEQDIAKLTTQIKEQHPLVKRVFIEAENKS